MCCKLPTKFLICQIADYDPQLQSRNAVILKQQDCTQFHAFIQPTVAKEAKNEVTVLPCNETYSKFTGNPFNCYLPENKSFQDLSVDDVLKAVFF